MKSEEEKAMLDILSKAGIKLSDKDGVFIGGLVLSGIRIGKQQDREKALEEVEKIIDRHGFDYCKCLDNEGCILNMKQEVKALKNRGEKK